MITEHDIPKYGNYDTRDGVEINLPNGWTARVRVEPEEEYREPWKEEDGHGPVSVWRALDSKRPGERVLVEDHKRARFYDFADAVRIARKDGWGCDCKPDHATKDAAAACAAALDFERLRRYCAGDWSYVSLLVTLYDAEGEEVGPGDVLGGVESDGDYWRAEAAEMINGLVGGIVMPANEGTEGDLMDAYIYQAALYCFQCGNVIRAKLHADGDAPENVEDERTYDSDEYPKGPFADAGGEADSPQHCDACGVFLKNPLTVEGYKYTRDCIAEAPTNDAVKEWAVFYDIAEGTVTP